MMLTPSWLRTMPPCFAAGAHRRGGRKAASKFLHVDELERRDLLSAMLGLSELAESSGAGSDTVLLRTDSAWTAISDAPWLHTNSSGTGSASVLFTFDANSGEARTGTLTIAGQDLTVSQAGTDYVSVNPITTIVSSGLRRSAWRGDGSPRQRLRCGHGQQRVKRWDAATQQITTLVASGLKQPYGLAVDASGNVYIADTGNSVVKKWDSTTQQVTTLISTGLSFPYGVAVDASGSVYIADTLNNAVKKWDVTTQQVTTLVSIRIGLPVRGSRGCLGRCLYR